MRQLRKAIALLLCLAMCLTLTPAAWAEEPGEDDFLVWEDEPAGEPDPADEPDAPTEEPDEPAFDFEDDEPAEDAPEEDLPDPEEPEETPAQDVEDNASKPVITTQPEDVTANDGTTATFTVTASGTGLSYQWQYRKTANGSWSNSTSASGKTATFTVNAREAINGYQYRCKVSNSAGAVYSSIVTLTVASAPTITTQPEDITVADGTTATFSVTASGTGLSYQWQYRKTTNGSWSNSTSASGKTSTFTVNARAAINGYQYRCAVSNSAGTVYSSTATLTVVMKPTITTQPKDVTAADGTTATFTVAASGTGLSYQWQYRKTTSGSWTDSTSASGKTSTFTVNARAAINGYQYRCKVSNNSGSVYSSIVTLTVASKPTITTQPEDITAADGTTATFSVTASGTGLSFQWQYRKTASGTWTDSTSASGKTSTFTVNARAAINGYQYRCKVSNNSGSVYSSIVTLTVASAPTITTQPEDITAADGTTATFSVAASGTGLSYQWQYRKTANGSWSNSTSASGKTATFTVNAREAINGYQYRCKVSNSAGAVYSSIVTLTVASAPTITTQPKDVTAADGTTATFTVAASGTGLSYQWQYRKTASGSWSNSTSASGKTATFTVNARTAINGYQYRCKVSNSSGAVYSNVVTLTVISAPTITTQPKNVTAADGTTATFSVAASGTGLCYQWQYRKTASGSWTNSTSPSGKTPEFTVNARTAIDGYQYRCVVSNSVGTATSEIATLSVGLPINEANFPDANFRAVVSGVDQDENGVLSKSELAVTYLDCANQNIADLTGIEHFTALEQLSCDNNPLTSLDLSANTALRGLGCGYTDLTALDLSANTALVSMDCEYCPALETVVLPEGIEQIRTWTFIHCTALREINIPSTVTSIGYCAFLGCESLTEITLPDGLSSIETCAFKESGLTSVSIPGSVTELTESVFAGCTALESVSFGEGLTTIGEAAFDGCTALRTVSLPSTLSTVAYEAFIGCTALESGSFAGTQEQLDAVTIMNGNEDLIRLFYDLPVITAQPASVTVNAGEEVNFTVAASDANAYRWQTRTSEDDDWADVSDAAEATLSFTATAEQNGAQYRCVVSNRAGEVSSNAAVLSVNADGLSINETNFPDAMFRSYVSVICDTNGDGSLSAAEIEAVTSIDCSQKGIASLKGVEHFTGLKYLYCWSNDLTSLDVSKNTALTELDCGFCGLTSLDVSKNTRLTDLRCTLNGLTSLNLGKNNALYLLYCDSNELTSLDVSGCTALAKLDCAYNMLSGLDLSKNTALTRLNCDSNQLTNLDLSNNPALTRLGCSFNQLTGLDLSNNAALTQLSCYGNQLTTLDVTNCSGLAQAITNGTRSEETFDDNANIVYWAFYNDDCALLVDKNVVLIPADLNDAVEIDSINFPDANFRSYVSSNYDTDGDARLSEDEIAAVTEINCNGLEISDLTGIEHFTALASLSCSNNQLSSLDISNNTALTALNCEDNQLTGLDLSDNTALAHLFCAGNQLTSLGVSNNTALVSLRCSDNQLTSLDLGNNTALNMLVCSSNQLTSLDVSNNSALTRLSCFGNQLTRLDVSMCSGLAQAITNGTRSEETLDDIAYWAFYSDDCALLVDKIVLLTPADPNSLVIDETNFPDANFRSYVSSTFDTDEDAHLSEDEIAAVTEVNCFGQEIADLTGIQHFTALEQLSCGNNPLTSLDLSANTALRFLECGNTMLTALDLSANTALVSMDCEYCPSLETVVLPEGIEQIRTWTFIHCSSLREINIPSTVTDIGYCAFLGCESLTEITLPEGLSSIETCAFKESGLTSVYIPGSVTELTESVFAGCTALESVSFGEGLTTIGEAAFDGCTALRTVSLPSTLTTIAYEAFIGCTALESGSFAGTQEQLDAMTIMNGNEDLIRLFYDLPVITAQPASITVNAGEEASFSVTASGAAAYRWQTRASAEDEWADVADADEAALSFTASVEQNGSQYRCVVSNRAGEVISETATLTVNPADLAIDETNFPDANFRSFVSENCDTNSDGKLSEDEIAAVTTIDCSEKGIASLKGVEHFTKLKNLDCRDNNLTSLNVSTNTRLTRLECSNNILTSLNLGQNTALTELNCSYSGLKSLNVSGCTALTKLYCSENLLTNLNVSGCTALKELDCSGNELMRLNVSTNTRLTRLECSNNILTSLNLGQNTALTELFCFYNDLESLDVSGCTALKELDCSDNMLSELDLSKNTKLEHLNCISNELETLDVSHCPLLTEENINCDWGVTIIG